jgi:translation initiation factor 1 (eIF-1/SUI1)
MPSGTLPAVESRVLQKVTVKVKTEKRLRREKVVRRRSGLRRSRLNLKHLFCVFNIWSRTGLFVTLSCLYSQL